MRAIASREPGQEAEVVARVGSAWEVVAPDIEWDTSPIAGGGPQTRYSGLAEFIDFWDEWLSVWEEYVYKVVEYVECGPAVIANLEIHAVGQGACRPTGMWRRLARSRRARSSGCGRTPRPPRRSTQSTRSKFTDMAGPRDLRVNFERMWREVDELIGDPFSEQWSRLTRSQSGFSPRVDVYYSGEPPRAVVKAELAGVDIDTVSLELAGRELVITGERPVAETEGASISRSRSRRGRSGASSSWAPTSWPSAPAPATRTAS